MAEGTAIWAIEQPVVAPAVKTKVGGRPYSSYPNRRPNDPTGVFMAQNFDAKNPVYFARKHNYLVDVDGQSNILPIPCEEGLTSKLSGVNRFHAFFETWVKENFVIAEEWRSLVMEWGAARSLTLRFRGAVEFTIIVTRRYTITYLDIHLMAIFVWLLQFLSCIYSALFGPIL